VSYTSYLPSLIDAEQLVDGNGKLATTQSVAQVAGPGLGALLVGLVGPARAVAGDAASFAIGAVSLFLIRGREQPAARAIREQRPRLGPQLREGLAYVLREPILRKSPAWSGTANFFVIMVETLGPVFLARTVHLRPVAVSVLLALGGLGGVAAGVVSKPLSARIGSARLCWLSMTLFTLPGLLIPLARPGWWVVLFAAGWMSWTFGATLCGIALISYQQSACPADMRGRVSAVLRWISWGTLPLGGLVAGTLGSVLGVHVMLWVAVIGGCLSGLWLYMSPLRGMRDLPAAGLVSGYALRRLRRRPPEHPDSHCDQGSSAQSTGCGESEPQ
jgi:predicted MFS family arabinose efflux permease